MSVPHPRQCCQNADSQGDGRDNAHSQYRGVIVLSIGKDDDQAKYQPTEARRRASGMNTSEMLQYWGAS